MKSIHISRFFLLLTTVGLAATSSSADTFVRDLSREFSVSGKGTLVIDVGSSNIEVRPGPDGQVSLQIVLSVKASSEEKANTSFDRIVPEFSQNDTHVELRLSEDRGPRSWFPFGRPPSPSVLVVVTCPPDFDLSLDTGSGSIDVEGISGKLAFDTGSGSVRGRLLHGHIAADTGSGSIKFLDVSGSLQADTGSGSIAAKGAIEQFAADTGSGSVHIQSTVPLARNSFADTGSGTILLQLPHQASFHLEAHTGSGALAISSAFPNPSPPSADPRSVNASFGASQPLIRLDSGSGSIRVEPLQP